MSHRCPTCMANVSDVLGPFCPECGASLREGYEALGVVVIPNCLCGEAIWRHAGEKGPCHSRACGCTSYRPKEAQR